jgi:hypothetical protein
MGSVGIWSRALFLLIFPVQPRMGAEFERARRVCQRGVSHL